MSLIGKHSGLVATGIFIGTAGIKILSTKEAKKVYTHVTAAALRAKECVMATVTKVRENADDVLVDAQKINEEREKDEPKLIEDADKA